MLLTSIAPSHLFFWVVRRLSVRNSKYFTFRLPFTSRPQVICVEFTNDCNMKCGFCAREIMTREIGYMPLDVYRKLISQAAKLPYVIMRVVGLGESSLHPNFKEMIKLATDNRIAIDLTSNGHILEVMSPQEIFDSSITVLNISIDGFNDGTYEKLRVGGDYDRLRRKIERFYKAKRLARRRRPMFNLRMILTGRSAEQCAVQADRFWREWKEICDRVSFNTLTRLNPDRAHDGSRRVCDNVFYNVHVEWNGQVPLCGYQHLFTKQEIMGDLSEQSLVGIWRNPRREEVGRAHLSGDLSSVPFCAKCPQQRAGKTYENMSNHVQHRSWLDTKLERFVFSLIR